MVITLSVWYTALRATTRLKMNKFHAKNPNHKTYNTNISSQSFFQRQVLRNACVVPVDESQLERPDLPLNTDQSFPYHTKNLPLPFLRQHGSDGVGGLSTHSWTHLGDSRFFELW